MRLTLRTLLAYLDDILEPADHEDLGHKIETSDFATELIHRSRDVARRLRLGAPAIDAGAADVAAVGSAGRQSAGVRVADANVVAEYLDNTLPPEDLAEFERLCIEPSSKADMHLAEVVSCHHVLTMVLGEPAEIDHQLKERLYRLPADLASGKKLRIESAHVASPQVSSATATPATAQQSGSHSATTVLPDYLQAAAASRARGRRLLLAAATVLGLGVLAWLVTPMFLEPEVPADLIPAEMEMFTGEVLIEGEPLVILEESNLGANPATEIQLAQSAETAGPLLARPPTTPSGPVEDSVEEVPNTPAPTISPADDPVEPAPAALADVASPTAPAAEPTAAAETAEAASQVETAAPQDQPPAFEFAAPEVPASAGERSADDPAWSRENSPGGDGDIVFDASDALSAAGAVRADAGPLVTDSRELAAEDAGLVDARAEDADVGDADVASVDAIGAGPAATTDQAEPVAAEPVQVGNYLGNHDVLLRYDAPSQEWVRLPPRSPLFTDEVLLSLPKFRTHVVLEDINLYLSGGTQLGLLPATRAAAIELALDYGRALFIAGMQGNSIALQLGDQRRQFQLEGSASLAVEVRRVFVPGSDFSQQSPVEVVWYLTSGTVIWPNAAGQQQTIAAPAMWKTSAGIDDLPTEIMELPAWMDREPLTDSERRARDTLDAELPTGNSVALRMLELSSQNGLGRRREVRTLTAEACVYVGIFEPSVQALNDMALIRTWEVQIDTLRQAMARSPQVAEQVREAFVHQRGVAAAGDLMEMLGGYAIDALGDNRSARQTGALAKLIGWLEHDSLDYRVLAIHNLNEITGVYVPNQKRRTANLGGFKPNGPSQRRQIAVKKLWERLEAGDLLPQN